MFGWLQLSSKAPANSRPRVLGREILLLDALFAILHQPIASSRTQVNSKFKLQMSDISLPNLCLQWSNFVTLAFYSIYFCSIPFTFSDFTSMIISDRLAMLVYISVHVLVYFRSCDLGSLHAVKPCGAQRCILQHAANLNAQGRHCQAVSYDQLSFLSKLSPRALNIHESWPKVLAYMVHLCLNTS